MTKTISLSDDAYHVLASLKRPGESFSDVALRLGRLHHQRSILDLAGRWRMTAGEADRLKRDVYAARDASREPRVRFP